MRSAKGQTRKPLICKDFRVLSSGQKVRDLLPLNGPGGLGGEVVEDAVDAFDFGGNAAEDAVEKVIGDGLDGGGHGVGGVDGPDDGAPFIHTLAILDAHAFQIGHGGKILPDLPFQAGVGKLLPQNGIGLPHGLQPVTGDGAGAADPQAGTGEGLAVDHAVGQTQLFAHHPNLVLEQDPNRLHQLEFHILG